jgi:SAM-dependent methyltransferase
MSNPISSAEETARICADAIIGPDFRRATFTGPARVGDLSWERVAIRPVVIRDEPHLQFTYFDGRKTLTKNHRGPEAEASLAELLAAAFAGVHIETASEELNIRNSKKGTVQFGRRALTSATPKNDSHNRVKDVPLPEGKADQVLEAMGILTTGGHVKPTMRAKFTQINEFLKHLGHVLDDAGLRSLGRPVEILDCGCGASYLTLAVHHYLNDVLAVPARILGVDVNDEVIRKSVERAGKLGTSGLAFACGKIGDIDTKADLVLALHACDTATDDALAQAIRSEAKLVLSVPCCHHALNKDLHAAGDANVLRPILRHGILRERTADLVTDAFRALILRIMGYRTDVVEFVATEHTARNLMIRAVRNQAPGDAASVREYRELKSFWSVTPYLERLLGESFQQFLDRQTPTTPQ